VVVIVVMIMIVVVTMLMTHVTALETLHISFVLSFGSAFSALENFGSAFHAFLLSHTYPQ
jgi:hypothetical protein